MAMDEMKMQELMETVGEVMAEYIEANVPPSAVFKTQGFRFDVYGTRNEGILQVSYKGPGECSLRLGVYRAGTDRLFSNFLPSGSNEELVRYLKDPASHAEWLKLVKGLSDKADDFWD